MIVEQTVSPVIFSPLSGLLFLINGGIILLLTLYFFFSLIVVRQVKLMTETLITEVAPFIRAFSILHAGFALGLILLFIGFLFG